MIYRIVKNHIIFMILFGTCSFLQTAPFVTNFVNAADANLQLELHFSDDSIEKKGIGLFQSYQVVNFQNKVITSVMFSSKDKDKNGNFYGQLHQQFSAPKKDITYNILLQDVPAHMVSAGPGTEEFKMPDSQEFVCKKVSSEKNNIKK